MIYGLLNDIKYLMKVSKAKKEETRRLLIETAVEMILEEGYKKATMKKIASKAGVGPATIYKYFSTKEKLLVGFYVLKAQDAISDLEKVKSFSEFNLKEKLQMLLENYLEHLLVDREFVLQSLEMILKSASLAYSDTTPIKKEFKSVVDVFLEAAVESGEIEELPFGEMVSEMLCHYFVGILIYWSKDESEEFSDTTQMIDLSLDVGYTILNSGLLNKTFDAGAFFLKSFFFRSMGGGGSFLKNLAKVKSGLFC